MRRFYKQICFDKNLKRFYVACAVCGERRYAERLPLICRNNDLLPVFEKGRAELLQQRAYNHAKAKSVQYLARFFNQCISCGNWVCDDCYDPDSTEGLCRYCTQY